MIFEKGDRIVFAGDSVTDMGSQLPVGEGLRDNVGHGFVRSFESLTCSVYPDLTLRITNSGISGNTSRDLIERWERDVLSLNPDWVHILIGVNDVWRQFDTPAITDDAVPLDEYEKNVEDMLSSLQGKVKGVLVSTPYYMEPNSNDLMRTRMDEYGAVCKKLAEKYGCIFIDLQAMFNTYFKYKHSSYIAWDRVHPNRIGADLIAREILKHCDFDFNRNLK